MQARCSCLNVNNSLIANSCCSKIPSTFLDFMRFLEKGIKTNLLKRSSTVDLERAAQCKSCMLRNEAVTPAPSSPPNASLFPPLSLSLFICISFSRNPVNASRTIEGVRCSELLKVLYD